MKKKANPNLQIFGATVLMTHLGALVQEGEGVRLGSDIEAVHRMRVASRRLRATIPLFGPSLAGKRHLEWIEVIRGVTRALGQARDKDVQIEHVVSFLEPLQPPYRAGVRRLLLRLRQQRAEIQPAVLKSLQKLEKSGLVPDMAQKLAPFEIFHDRLDPNDPVLLGVADQAIREKLGAFLRYDEFVTQPDRVEELHAMRIAAKRLRYTLETFTPLFEDGLKPSIKAMRSSQDMLGAIHDADIWQIEMPRFIEQERSRTIEYFGTIRPFKRLIPGLTLYQESRQLERNQIYSQFLSTWEGWKRENLWEDLKSFLADRTTFLESTEDTSGGEAGPGQDQGELPAHSPDLPEVRTETSAEETNSSS